MKESSMRGGVSKSRSEWSENKRQWKRIYWEEGRSMWFNSIPSETKSRCRPSNRFLNKVLRGKAKPKDQNTNSWTTKMEFKNLSLTYQHSQPKKTFPTRCALPLQSPQNAPKYSKHTIKVSSRAIPFTIKTSNDNQAPKNAKKKNMNQQFWRK